MIGPILSFTPPPPPLDRREILRYARAGAGDAATEALLERVLAECEPLLEYRAVYRVMDAESHAGVVTTDALSVTSRDLAALLAPCRRVLIVAATVGARFDRYLLRLSRLHPAEALMADAIGTERIEALMDALERHLAGEGMRLSRRFSPGYGDLPLALQRDLFPLLDCERRLGLSLGERLLMSPRKSVTAFLGVSD